MTREKLINWAKQEMYSFIKDVEKRIVDSGKYGNNFELTGNRIDVERKLPVDIYLLYDALKTLPTEAQKAMIESYILRPWGLNIKGSYIELYPEEKETIEFMLKAYGLESVKPEIITFWR